VKPVPPTVGCELALWLYSATRKVPVLPDLRTGALMYALGASGFVWCDVIAHGNGKSIILDGRTRLLSHTRCSVNTEDGDWS
jgi:hypothetical protein